MSASSDEVSLAILIIARVRTWRRQAAANLPDGDDAAVLNRCARELWGDLIGVTDQLFPSERDTD